MDPRNLERARGFLKLRRIAVVGLSRNEKDFSRYVFKALAERGIELVPVHPELAQAEGRPCFARLQDVVPPVDGALLLTPPAQSDRVLADCVEAGVTRVWLHRGGGPGAASAGALAFCASHGIEAVHDLCPFMALDGAGVGHRVHGWFRRRLA